MLRGFSRLALRFPSPTLSPTLTRRYSRYRSREESSTSSSGKDALEIAGYLAVVVAFPPTVGAIYHALGV